MSDKIFVDTNILVYSVADDQYKRAIADDLLMKNEIVISPQVKIGDENEVIGAILDYMKKSSAMADTAGNIWNQAHTLKVRREEPRWTGRGKLMSLHVERRHHT